MMVLLNPEAGGGKAPGRWRRLVASLPPFHENVEVQLVTPERDIHRVLEDAVLRNNCHVLAAGGDGTVNVALNAMMRLADTLRQRVILGAVGLGSSNDFHKPFTNERLIEGIPVRLNFREPTLRDVGQAVLALDGQSSIHYFLINSSIGTTAEGNALFNNPDPLLRVLKAHASTAAILYAAIGALIFHRNQRCSLEVHGKAPVPIRLTNLGVVKSPHFSGSLYYGTPPHYDDGAFGVHIAEGLGFIERLRLFRALAHGHFVGARHTSVCVAPGLTLTAPRPFIVELDGELRTADRVEFSVLSQAIRVCS
jgi:diacylglycerol kinase family enzyme